MADGTVVETPQIRQEGSRDALLRLPIQPTEAHLTNSPVSPVAAGAPADLPGVSPLQPGRARGNSVLGGDSSRWITFPGAEPNDDYPTNRRSNRYGPQEYRGSVMRRAAYVEDYSDEEDYPRGPRRPNRRHTRPPPAHGRSSGTSDRYDRYSHDRGDRVSFDSRAGYDYESDTPRKARFVRYSDDDDMIDSRHTRVAYAGGGGRRGPPRSPPSTEEVLRLPWTMWMNSDAKNRRSPRSHGRPRRRRPTPSLLGPLQSFASDSGSNHSMLPAQLSRRMLIMS